MTIQEFEPTINIRMTESAIQHARKQLAGKSGVQGLRLGVKASGCSGYKYVLDWVENLGEDDREVKIAEGVSVFVDSKSLPFVNATENDVVKEVLDAMYRFNNTSIASECGCGESFYLA